MRPPIFFKQRDAFARQIRNWPRPQLDQALRRIAETAKSARLSSRYEDLYAERLLLALASMAAAGLAASPRR
jgi:DNA polymerase-3 subunit delta